MNDDNKSGSAASAPTGRGRGLLFHNRKLNSAESGLGDSLRTSSLQTVDGPSRSCDETSRSEESSRKLDGSLSENDTGRETLTAESDSASAVTSELNAPVGKVHRKDDVFDQNQDGNRNANPYIFSNINCVRLEKVDDYDWSHYSVDFDCHEHLYPIDKRIIFLNSSIKETLQQNGIKTWCFHPPSTLYTSGKLLEDLTITTSIHSFTVYLKLKQIPDTIDYRAFYDALFQKIAMPMASPQNFAPLRLTPEQSRFERYPGEVIDVVVENDTKITVRCSSHHTDYGTVRDAISDCLMYAASEGQSKDYYESVVYESLKNLVVLTDIENLTMIVCEVSWEGELPFHPLRDRHFEKLGIRRQRRPVVVCRECNKDVLRQMEAENLTIQGSKRTSASSVLDRGFLQGGPDHMTPFLGQPVTGQQRQLAMMRYLNNARRERVRKELRDWGLELVDTAVISNGVLLKSDSTLRLGDGDVAGMATRGWFEMLSDQQVYSPIRISDWIVVAQRGDENMVRSMVDTFINRGPEIGIEILEPKTCRFLTTDTAKAFVDVLDALVKVNPKLQLAVVILRVSRDDIYREIKRWALISQEKQIATQILIRDTAKAMVGRPDVSLSVITQINVKLGGDLWTLDGSLNDILVIGMAAYYGVSGEWWVGAVSSKNRLFSKWYSAAFQEMTEFDSYLKNAFQKYVTENKGNKPSTVFVLRRNLAPMSDDEAASIQKVCGPECSVVVASLLEGSEYGQYMTSCFETKGKEALEELHSKLIYLPVRKGSPTDVIVFYLERFDQKTRLDWIRQVIQQLKHMYFNVAGEVPLPAPLLYAGKCAEFNADILEQAADEKFRDQLYYL